MSEWDLEPSPAKKPASSGETSRGAAAEGPSDADTEPPGASTTEERGGAPAPEAFSGAIFMPDAAGAAAAQSPPAQRGRSRRRLLGWIAAGVVLLLVGALIGFFIARSQLDQTEAELDQVKKELGLVQRALAQVEERNWNYYREKQSLEAALEEAQTSGQPSTSTTLPPDGSTEGYGDGVYLVGEDIPPGIYDGVVTGEQGYWARLKGVDGQVSQIVANGIPRGPFVLTLVGSDMAVELRGVRLIPR